MQILDVPISLLQTQVARDNNLIIETKSLMDCMGPTFKVRVWSRMNRHEEQIVSNGIARLSLEYSSQMRAHINLETDWINIKRLLLGGIPSLKPTTCYEAFSRPFNIVISKSLHRLLCISCNYLWNYTTCTQHTLMDRLALNANHASHNIKIVVFFIVTCNDFNPYRFFGIH